MVVTKDRPHGSGRSVPMLIVVKCEDHSAIQAPPCNSNDLTKLNWAVVVAQLVERSLPTPEIRSLNPGIAANGRKNHCWELNPSDFWPLKWFHLRHSLGPLIFNIFDSK